MNEETARKIEQLRQTPRRPEEAGPEFYDAGTARPEQPFRPDSAALEHADKVAKILTPETAAQAAPQPKERDDIHLEAGIPLPNEIRTEAAKREAAEKLMAMGSVNKISPNALNEGLESLMRDQAA